MGVCRTQGVDIDVAVYMGLLDEDIKKYGNVDVLLDAQKKMFGALQDPLRQTAVVNMDGESSSAFWSPFHVLLPNR